MSSRRRFLEGGLAVACACLTTDAESQTLLDISQTLTAFADARSKGDLAALSEFYADGADGKLVGLRRIQIRREGN
jgi:hypothetical protein